VKHDRRDARRGVKENVNGKKGSKHKLEREKKKNDILSQINELAHLYLRSTRIINDLISRYKRAVVKILRRKCH
jgi:hypothetical protein